MQEKYKKVSDNVEKPLSNNKNAGIEEKVKLDSLSPKYKGLTDNNQCYEITAFSDAWDENEPEYTDDDLLISIRLWE